MPDDAKTAIREAPTLNEAILEPRPAGEDVEPAVKTIEFTNPTHSNTDL